MKGYRTIIANVLLGILPVIELTEVRDVLPPDWLPWYSLAVVVLNLGLRSITTGPVGKT